MASIWYPHDVKFTHMQKISIFAPEGRLVAPINVKFGMADRQDSIANYASICTLFPPSLKGLHVL